MKSPLEAAACAVNVGILRAASLFVPARQRMEWRSEWRALAGALANQQQVLLGAGA